jgi:alpha-beta hydrolase superfamily lysophospholipase
VRSRPYLRREGLALVADIAGFWPIADHPLGGRSYRPAVVTGLVNALKRQPGERLVLVGHSQGSVICAWTLARPVGHPEFAASPPTPSAVHLVRPFLLIWVAERVGAENPVMSCDLHVLVEGAAESLSSQWPDGCCG